MGSRVTRTTVLDEGDPDRKREEIRRYFHDTCDIEELLYDCLAGEESFYLRADPLRHPLIFYLGHTAVFFINKLIVARLIGRRIDPKQESMFAVGVDEMSWDDLDMSHYDWPTLADVKAYRAKARELVDGMISELPLSIPIGWNDSFWAILMGIEHARIHLETSSVLIRQLPLDRVVDHPEWAICEKSGEPPANELLPVAGGEVRLGRPLAERLYGWDNEFGSHVEMVDDYRASRFLVTNREFGEFVEDGGYADETWWTGEGWAWRTYRKARQPRFWIADGSGEPRLRAMLREIAMPWDWPVEVNYLEAKAFCNWKTARTGAPIRLPTEEEWYRLRDSLEIPDQPDWEKAPGNINLEYWSSPCPVTEFGVGGFHDVIGNVWQWTETPITGFEGFRIHPWYDDFSTPTFDARHNVIKGGSWISTGNEATRDSRYAFRRHFFQHAGFRYIESGRKVVVRSDAYETDASVAQYCEGHYGDDVFGVPNLSAQVASICLEAMGNRPRRRALDLGCAVGRLTFELARGFEEVTGLDFSARFIRAAISMKEAGHVRYVLVEEGEITSYRERRLADLGLDESADRTAFYQADACNLKPLYAGYDLVVAVNILDRLYAPRKFLTSIHERIEPGGLLILASPYTWVTEHTEREEWIGGFREDGEPVTTLEALHSILSPSFRAVGEPREVEFVLRETARKYQHTLSQLTVWEKGA